MDRPAGCQSSLTFRLGSVLEDKETTVVTDGSRIGIH